jgi:hypothetical protein
MVETLKTVSMMRNHLDNVGLVIIDEAHYNSFGSYLVRLQMPLFLVTATPLSSNIITCTSDELIVGIPSVH